MAHAGIRAMSPPVGALVATAVRAWRLVPLTFALIGKPAAAAVDDARPRLEWHAPPECIRAAELSRAVTVELGRPAFAAPGAPGELVVRGHVERTQHGLYRAEFALERASGAVLGVRALTSDTSDCRSLDEATAVMLAIMLNVRREELQPEPSPWSYRLSAAGGATLGLVPGVGLEVTASGGPALPRVLGLDLELGVVFGRERPADEGTIRGRVGSARLAASPVLVAGAVELSLHTAAGAGAMEATAAGFPQTTKAIRPFMDLRAGVHLAVPISRPVWLGFGVDAGFLPIRPRFVVRNPDGTREELYEPRAVYGSLALSLSFRPL